MAADLKETIALVLQAAKQARALSDLAGKLSEVAPLIEQIDSLVERRDQARAEVRGLLEQVEDVKADIKRRQEKQSEDQKRRATEFRNELDRQRKEHETELQCLEAEKEQKIAAHAELYEQIDRDIEAKRAQLAAVEAEHTKVSAEVEGIRERLKAF